MTKLFPWWITDRADIYIWEWENVPKDLADYLKSRKVSTDDISYVGLIKVELDTPPWMETGTSFAPTELMRLSGNKVYDIVIGYHS